jgi:hypothetical protein
MFSSFGQMCTLFDLSMASTFRHDPLEIAAPTHHSGACETWVPLGPYQKDRYGEPERGGSEWEPIKILLEGDGYSNKTNTASNTRLRLTTQVGQAHVATRVLLDQGTYKQPSVPKLTNTHNENLHGLLPVMHRSDRWPAPVRPVTPVRLVDRAG